MVDRIRLGLLRALRRGVMAVPILPGRYIIAMMACRYLAPKHGWVTSTLGPYRFRLDLSDTIQQQVFFGLYDRSGTSLLQQRLRRGDVFFDIGANIGYFTVLAAGLVGPSGHVVAFEPVPSNAAAIRGHLTDNQIAHASVIESAIADQSGTLSLHLPDHIHNTGWASVVPSKTRPRSIDVRVEAIDEFLLGPETPSPTLIKIDIEGAEPRALAGMTQLMSSDSAPDLIVEVNPYLLTALGVDSSAITIPLRDAGYSLYVMNGQRLVAFDNSERISKLIDLYATKRTMK